MDYLKIVLMDKNIEIRNYIVDFLIFSTNNIQDTIGQDMDEVGIVERIK